jgi:hypothetical protein
MVYIVSSSHSFFNSWPTNSETIKQVKKTDVIDEFLSWCDHIDLILKKNIICTAVISRIRHFTNLNSLKLIYYALVYSYLMG